MSIDDPGQLSPGPRGADPVSFGQATRTWFGISLQTFGGPAAQIAVMHRVLVDEKRWIGERRFLHALSFCTLLPGPEAQQLATYCGWLLHGTGGGLVAGLLFILPGFLVLLAVSLLYAGAGDTTLVAALFAGVAPAVLPVVVQAVQRVAKRALGTPVSVALAIGAFAALFLFNVPFPFVVAAAGVAGLVGGYLRPAAFEVRHPAIDADPEAPAPLIADDALHDAPRSGRRAIGVLAAGVAIWSIPIVGLALWQGTSSTLFEQALFFSGAAVVTFGGAYAVLAYIGQRAVDVYGWLLPGEMATALALAETTPGPLIQLVQFVGFMGAYRSPGDLDPWVAGIIATIVVVWVTFVPCFLWIFLGAPYIEGLRNNRLLNHALTAVTASVVGVIANLAAYFAVHTLFGDVDDGRAIGPLRMSVPEWSSLEWQAVAIAIGAALLLFRFRASVARTVLLAGACGGVLYLLTT
jgi:chromate transporter